MKKESSAPQGSFAESRLRVRYAETDQMGVVYHANYFIWFEVGRVEYCRQRGVSYREMEQEHETFLPVCEARCRFIRPARYDDEIIIRVRLEQLRRRSLKFVYEVIRSSDGCLLAEGETVHFFLNTEGRPRSLSPVIARMLTG